MKKYILTLFMLLITTFTFAIKIGDMPKVQKPYLFHVDGDDLILVERDLFSVNVYSLKTLKLKNKFGGRGEGPGEFKIRPFISEITPNHIMGCGWSKVVWFSRDGKILKEKLHGYELLNYLEPIKENYAALSRFFDRSTGDAGWTVVLLDSQFKKIKDVIKLENVMRIEFTWQDRSTLKHDLIRNVVEKVHYDDKIFLANSIKGFYFDVFDYQGNHLYSIDKNDQVKKIKVDNAYKERLKNFIKTHNKRYYDNYLPQNFRFFEYLPAFKTFRISDNKIFVFTHREKDGLRELIVLDLKGKILFRDFLPIKAVHMHVVAADTITINNGVLYELVDNQKTEMWELHKTDLSAMIKK